MNAQLVIRALAAGILVAFAFPPAGLWPLSLVAFAYIAYEFLREPSRQQPRFLALYTFFVHFFGFYWIGYLLHEFGALAWPFAVILMLVGFGVFAGLSWLFAWLWVFLARRVPVLYRPLALFFWFIFWDSLEFRFFPWSPAITVGGNRYLLATAGIFGTMGWRVIFFSLAVLLAWLYRHRTSNRVFVRRASVAVSTYALLTFATGLWNLRRLQNEYSARQPVALLQGNVGNYEKVLSEQRGMPTTKNVMRIHQDLVEEAAIHFAEKSAAPDGPEPWVFWPETSVPGWPLSEPQLGDQLFEWTKLTRGLHIIGTYEKAPGIFAGRPTTLEYNSVLLVHESRGLLDSYRKHLRIPFGEYVPFDEYLPQVYQWLPAVNHFGAGDKFIALVHPDPQGPVFVPLVCFEILFSGFSREFVRAVRAQYPGRDIILVNPTNDSWYGPTSEPYAHSFMARWQAASLGLPLLRPTNTGFSQVIAPWGEAVASGPQDQSTVVFAELPVKKLQRRQP